MPPPPQQLIVFGRARSRAGEGTYFKTLRARRRRQPRGVRSVGRRATKTMGLSDYRFLFFLYHYYYFVYIIIIILFRFFFRFVFWLTRPAGASVTTSPPPHTISYLYIRVSRAHYVPRTRARLRYNNIITRGARRSIIRAQTLSRARRSSTTG